MEVSDLHRDLEADVLSILPACVLANSPIFCACNNNPVELVDENARIATVVLKFILDTLVLKLFETILD